MIVEAHKHRNKKNNRQNYISRNKSTKASPPVANANVQINVQLATQNLQSLISKYNQKEDFADTRGFLTDLRNALGIPNTEGASKYGVVQGNGFISSISLTNHNANAQNYINANANYPYNLRIMVRRRFRKNTFKSVPEVNLKEYVYFGQNMIKCRNGNPYVLIIEGIIEFLSNGVYNDKTGIAILNESKNNESKTNKNMKQNTIKLNESQLRKIVTESVKNILSELDWHLNESSLSFDTIEDLCRWVGCSIDNQQEAQLKIEQLLIYLHHCGVIENFNEDKLDWLFSDEQSY